MNKLILISSLLFLSVHAHAEVFKWTDEDGNVHYGSQPPIEADASKVKVQSSTDTKPQAQPQQKTAEPTPSEQTAKPATTEQDKKVAQQDQQEQDECTALKAKLEKYKKGLIDFSTTDEKGNKFTPSKAKVIRAYEEAIQKACS